MHSSPRDGGARAEVPGLQGLTESQALRLPVPARLPRPNGPQGAGGGPGSTEGEEAERGGGEPLPAQRPLLGGERLGGQANEAEDMRPLVEHVPTSKYPQ
eukprot:8420706-Pyramimonas_sp.AAC.1